VICVTAIFSRILFTVLITISLISMTHYMELLATNQPWNLIIYMAIPVILAEYLAVSELYLLFTRAKDGAVKMLNKYAGIVLGIYFSGVFLYLMKTAFLPLTLGGGWRGPADVIAVTSYLLGVVPLAGIAVLELGLIGRGKTESEKLKLHATFIGIFLIVAHIAMIFGMLKPELLMGVVGSPGKMGM
jgi:hypothetical protein